MSKSGLTAFRATLAALSWKNCARGECNAIPTRFDAAVGILESFSLAHSPITIRE